MTTHLPRHVLERLVAADLSGEHGPADGHVASCEHCRARLLAMETARSAYLDRYPAEPFARSIVARSGARRSRWWERLTVGRRLRIGAVALCASVAVVLLLFRPHLEPGIRLKG